jgi:hypothetical protein
VLVVRVRIGRSVLRLRRLRRLVDVGSVSEVLVLMVVIGVAVLVCVGHAVRVGVRMQVPLRHVPGLERV